MAVEDFYDRLSPYYHLIYPNWDQSIARQAEDLDDLIREFVGSGPRRILDASCGIGTQALGLAQLGHTVTASDLSTAAVERARGEARNRGLSIAFAAANLTSLASRFPEPFEVVLACDNSVPHLLSDGEILRGLQQLYRCTAPGGLCLLSVRDYDSMDRSGTQIHPYGVRTEGDVRILLFQVWTFEEQAGDIYEVSLYLVRDEGSDQCETFVARTRYYAVSIARLSELMEQAGFREIRRLDERFFQPILAARRPPAAETPTP